MEEEPNPNAPTPRQAAILRLPNVRHCATRVGPRTNAHGPINTVAMPWVDFDADMETTLAGACYRVGDRFEVNGRGFRMQLLCLTLHQAKPLELALH